MRRNPRNGDWTRIMFRCWASVEISDKCRVFFIIIIPSIGEYCIGGYQPIKFVTFWSLTYIYRQRGPKSSFCSAIKGNFLLLRRFLCSHYLSKIKIIFSALGLTVKICNTSGLNSPWIPQLWVNVHLDRSSSTFSNQTTQLQFTYGYNHLSSMSRSQLIQLQFSCFSYLTTIVSLTNEKYDDLDFKNN